MVFCLILWPPAGWACTPALLPVICLCGLAAAREDALQIQGLADVPDGREGAHKPSPGQVAPAVAPWSGTGVQVQVRPRRRMRDRRDAARCAADACARPRAFAARDTAGGRAIRYSAPRSAALGGCRRRVIDISGECPENAGVTVGRARRAALAMGIEINAVAVENMGPCLPIRSFYRRWVVTRGGFVMTALGLGAIRAASVTRCCAN